MSGLEQEFGDLIEFVLLDVDDRSLDPIREHYGITGRTQYVLVDENDEIIRRWYGPLSRQSVAADLQAFLDGEL